ncbi:glycoside hydrolase N-terminal domain-containing protein [Cellulomonas bogoriensis]|uniref:Glycosyl hydrolase family 95 N-terminal domain-containing protein n=1 Tax=Cellulomonas bogoriensis 69B4 = DSM 16987 TaxID=1386082 RepID=A0A0A0BYE1_9CELL|nr:glycoside hydrolase N-terminal domain-containing protein [Cellulomonas bogoriensis]KGM12946.1 hypothetical protein N869_00460 [Cellulomonas bogoriensis 69B4 = DSM 16987]
MTSPIFETRSTPTSWEDGLVVGSGRVGVVVHEERGRHVLSIAHERFFVPLHPRPAAPDLRPVLADIRRAVTAGHPRRAGELLTGRTRACGYPDGLVWTDPLGICASLVVTPRRGTGTLRREIDLTHGEVTVHWQDDDGGHCSLRVITPRDQESVCVAVESEHELTLPLEMSLGGSRDTVLDTGGGDGSAAVQVTVVGGRCGRLTATTNQVTAVVTARVPAPWHPDGASLTSRLVVPAGGRSTFRIDVQTVAGVDAAAPGPEHPDTVSWADVRARQASTHGRLVETSVLDLDGGDVEGTTEHLWAAARRGDPPGRPTTRGTGTCRTEPWPD